MKRRLLDAAVWLGIVLCCTFLACALAYPALAQPANFVTLEVTLCHKPDVRQVVALRRLEMRIRQQGPHQEQGGMTWQVFGTFRLGPWTSRELGLTPAAGLCFIALAVYMLVHAA